MPTAVFYPGDFCKHNITKLACFSVITLLVFLQLQSLRAPGSVAISEFQSALFINLITCDRSRCSELKMYDEDVNWFIR